MQKKRLSKKIKKPKFEVISEPERRNLLGLTEKEEEELKRLLREINGKSEERKKKDQAFHSEHDPDLPPAA